MGCDLINDFHWPWSNAQYSATACCNLCPTAEGQERGKEKERECV